MKTLTGRGLPEHSTDRLPRSWLASSWPEVTLSSSRVRYRANTMS